MQAAALDPSNAVPMTSTPPTGGMQRRIRRPVNEPSRRRTPPGTSTEASASSVPSSSSQALTSLLEKMQGVGTLLVDIDRTELGSRKPRSAAHAVASHPLRPLSTPYVSTSPTSVAAEAYPRGFGSKTSAKGEADDALSTSGSDYSLSASCV